MHNAALKSPKGSYISQKDFFLIFGIELPQNSQMDFFSTLEYLSQYFSLEEVLNNETSPFGLYIRKICTSFFSQNIPLEPSQTYEYKNSYLFQFIKGTHSGEYNILKEKWNTSKKVSHIGQNDKTETDEKEFDTLLLGIFKDYLSKSNIQENIELSDDDFIEICHYYLSKTNYIQLQNVAMIASNIFPEISTFNYYLGISYYFQDDNSNAEKCLNEYLNDVPDDLDALGYVFMMQCIELLNGLSVNGINAVKNDLETLGNILIKIYNKEDSNEIPYNIWYAGTLVFHNIGWLDAACIFGEIAYTQDPSDDTIFAIVGAAYERQGKFKDAYDWLITQYEIYNGESDYEENLKRLERKINS